MSRKNQRPVTAERASDPHGAPAVESKAAPEAEADPGVEASGDELLGQFAAIAVRLRGEIDRRVEERLRENADFKFGLDFDREIRELKQYNAALRKIISGFERLKKANNERLEDLKWLRGPVRPDRPRFPRRVTRSPRLVKEFDPGRRRCHDL